MVSQGDDADFWEQIKTDLEGINQRINERAKWLSPQAVMQRALVPLPLTEMVATVAERRDKAIIRAWEGRPRPKV